jgi:glutaredoxin
MNGATTNTETGTENEDEVVMYGSDWCGYTQRARGWMKEWSLKFHYVNIDQNPEAQQLIASWNEGRAIRPTFEIGGAVFVNPDMSTLQHELRSRGLLAE